MSKNHNSHQCTRIRTQIHSFFQYVSVQFQASMHLKRLAHSVMPAWRKQATNRKNLLYIGLRCRWWQQVLCMWNELIGYWCCCLIAIENYRWSSFIIKRPDMTRAHSFPRQILQNSAAPFAKFRGSPRQILGIPRLTAAAHYRLHCADFGPFIYLTNRLMNQRSSSSTKVQ